MKNLKLVALYICHKLVSMRERERLALLLLQNADIVLKLIWNVCLDANRLKTEQIRPNKI